MSTRSEGDRQGGNEEDKTLINCIPSALPVSASSPFPSPYQNRPTVTQSTANVDQTPQVDFLVEKPSDTYVSRSDQERRGDKAQLLRHLSLEGARMSSSLLRRESYSDRSHLPSISSAFEDCKDRKSSTYLRKIVFAVILIGGTFFALVRREKVSNMLHWDAGNSHGHDVSHSNSSSTVSCSSDALNKTKAEKDEEEIEFLKQRSSISEMSNGIVSTDLAICSDIGLSILRDKGGNAIDAAVASTLCLGVSNPASSGIGGGCFILIHASNTTSDGEKMTEVIDARETAPEGSTFDMFEDLPKESSTDGGLAVAVLGELRGLEMAHQRHGSLPWSTLVEPAAVLARDGVHVSKHLADAIERNKAKIDRFPPLKSILSNSASGDWLREGDLLIQPQLAETLFDVAKNGANAVYKGQRAEKLVQEIQEIGGILTKEDLEGYKPLIREPLYARAMGYVLAGVPPPSSGGGTVLGMLRFLAGYHESSLILRKEALTQHRIVEAMKHAFAIRMELSDPMFGNSTTNEDVQAIDDLVRGDYMNMLREKYTKDDTVMPLHVYGGPKWGLSSDGEQKMRKMRRRGLSSTGKQELQRSSSGHQRRARLFNYLEDHGTAHLSVIDRDRNAVSLTSTVNTEFGSGVWSPSTGIFWNNEMDDFSTPGRPNTYGLSPSVANYISPGKRPLSSMSPTLVFLGGEEDSDVERSDTKQNLGVLFMALGASGGPLIITAVLQTFLYHAVLGMPLHEAAYHPRLHDQLLFREQPTTLVERDGLAWRKGPMLEVSNTTKDALSRRNHNLSTFGALGFCQAVSVDLETGNLSAVADVRKGGIPAGY